MIRAIAAVDDRLGLATDTGIPWSVPADVEHFRAVTASVDVLMGYGTYVEFRQPMEGRANYVASGRGDPLREGFTPVADAIPFLDGHRSSDLWVIGGAALFAATLSRCEELHLTRISGDYGCTKFFPPYESTFTLVGDQATAAAGDVPAYRFQVWRRSP